MKFIKTFKIFESFNEPIFHRAKKTIFQPAFGGRKGKTDFYQISINDKPQAEIEILPKNEFDKPEILSLFVNVMYRDLGLGRILVDKIKDLYLKDEMYVLTTPDSKSFWLRMGAKEVESGDKEQYLLKFIK